MDLDDTTQKVNEPTGPLKLLKHEQISHVTLEKKGSHIAAIQKKQYTKMEENSA